MAHYDYEFAVKAARAEVLAEELQAAGIRNLIGVQVKPTGGLHQHQAQVPADEMIQNPDWPGWVENPDWTEDSGAHVDRFIVNPAGWKVNPAWTPDKIGQIPQYIPDMEVQEAWTHSPSHLLKRYDPRAYYTETTITDSGMIAIVRLSEPADGDALARIGVILNQHDAAAPTAAEKEAKAKAQAKVDAFAAIERANPALAGALRTLLDG